jgi:hypothetical protein
MGKDEIDRAFEQRREQSLFCSWSEPDANGFFCLLTMDGTGLRVPCSEESGDWTRSGKYMQHVYKGMVTVCIGTGKICDVMLSKEGVRNDVKLGEARAADLLPRLYEKEQILTDKGFISMLIKLFFTPAKYQSWWTKEQKIAAALFNAMQNYARARGEHINSLLKQFNVLSGIYRGKEPELLFHMLRVIAGATNIMLEHSPRYMFDMWEQERFVWWQSWTNTFNEITNAFRTELDRIRPRIPELSNVPPFSPDFDFLSKNLDLSASAPGPGLPAVPEVPPCTACHNTPHVQPRCSPPAAAHHFTLHRMAQGITQLPTTAVTTRSSPTTITPCLTCLRTTF